MKKVIKEFLLRGMMFGGFGPVVLGIIYLILFYTIADFSINGVNVFLGIISTYMLAFIQAGATVFNQIESWSILKSLTTKFSVGRRFLSIDKFCLTLSVKPSRGP